MAGAQGRCVEAREGVCGLPEEQGGADPPRRFTITASHSREEVGECIHGLHHRATSCAGVRLHSCGGRQTNQVHTFLFHTHRLQGHTSRRFVLQGGIPVAWVTQVDSQ